MPTRILATCFGFVCLTNCQQEPQSQIADTSGWFELSIAEQHELFESQSDPLRFFVTLACEPDVFLYLPPYNEFKLYPDGQLVYGGLSDSTPSGEMPLRFAHWELTDGRLTVSALEPDYWHSTERWFNEVKWHLEPLPEPKVYFYLTGSGSRTLGVSPQRGSSLDSLREFTATRR